MWLRYDVLIPAAARSGASSPIGPSPAELRPAPRIRVATFDDYDRMAAVAAATGLTPKPQDEWLHLWLGNPAYKRLPGWPIGWVLEDSAGRVVGSICNIPFRYRYGETEYIAASGHAWSVEPNYRGSSLTLLSRQMRQPRLDLLVSTSPSATAAALFERLGWRRAPGGKWNRAAFWVTNYAGALRSVLQRRWPCVTDETCRTTTPEVPALRQWREGVTFEWRSEFDARFDTFWDEFSRKNPGVLLADRSAEALQWHYAYALRSGRLWILAASKGTRLIAYAIFRRRNTKLTGLRLMEIVDFNTLAGDSSMCATMIAAAAGRCRREGIHVLENAGCWIEGEQFVNAKAPFHRRLGCWSYLYTALNPHLKSALAENSCWHPTRYDGDACL